MDYKREKEIKDIYDVVKYNQNLQLCRGYINILNSGFVTLELAVEAKNFSLNTYEEFFKEKPIIALANTCPVKRDVEPLDNLWMNLKALEKMLMEAIAENGDSKS